MPDVLGMHHEIDFFTHRNHQFTGRDVIAGWYVVLRIKTEEVRVTFINFVGMDLPEFAVRTGIAEIEGKLSGLSLHLQRIGRCGFEIHCAPCLRSRQSESENFRTHEQKSNDHHRGRAAWESLRRATLAVGKLPHE